MAVVFTERELDCLLFLKWEETFHKLRPGSDYSQAVTWIASILPYEHSYINEVLAEYWDKQRKE